jgi:hypothetical protein
MEWKEYDYSGEFSLLFQGIVNRPMIGVKLFYGSESINCFSLIDSGTDNTIINADFAKELGIDESKYPKVKVGVVDKSNAYGFIVPLKLKIDGFEKETDTKVIFLKDMNVAGLLGQKDIFENYKIRFEKKHKKFYLSEE